MNITPRPVTPRLDALLLRCGLVGAAFVFLATAWGCGGTEDTISSTDEPDLEDAMEDAPSIDAEDESADTALPDVPDGERVHVPEEGVLTVEANGLTFGYFEEGEGPLVLLIHGFPDTPHTFDDIRPALAQAGFRAVSPFTRGYTPTGIPADPLAYDARTQGEDVLALIEALGEEEAILVGHDWGAMAVYAAASLAPEKVSQLVTVAIPHPLGVTFDAEFLMNGSHFLYLAQDDAVEVMSANDFEHVEELYARWSPTWEPPTSEYEPVKNVFAAPGALEAVLGYYRAASPVPDPIFMTPISVPTLTIAGRDDGVTPLAFFEDARVGFEDGVYTVVELPGGHFTHRESPDLFLSALLEFLSSQ